jgi:predicted  nucleic acid-binding Zn ribbon protein
MAVNQLTQAWRQAGRMAAMGRPQFANQVHITAHIWKPRRGRYDPNNLWPTVKAVVDGFVDAGLLFDDDHVHVIGPDMRHGGVGPAQLILEIVPQNAPPTG